MEKKIEQIFLVSKINASENDAINCFYQEQNTCYRKSMV